MTCYSQKIHSAPHYNLFEILQLSSASESDSEMGSKPLKADSLQFQRHPDFSKWDKPFGVEQYVVNLLGLVLIHALAIWACVLTFKGTVPLSTVLFEFAYCYFGLFGVMIGGHRYWSHKTFKANKGLQVLLMIMQTVSCQGPIFKWSVEHRIHHKYSDTNADPHNSKRGLFFSHIGWLITPKHPEFLKKFGNFRAPDLEKDPILRFQSRWYVTLAITFTLIVPVFILQSIWNIPVLYCVAIICRALMMGLHSTYAINSFAHKFGDKPYDKNICSTENRMVSICAAGEGWHNYHHTFPWDYKASEFGWRINPSTILIDLFAWLGWASDLKTVSKEVIQKRVIRTADGSHVGHQSDYEMKHDTPVWGWGDEMIDSDSINATQVLSPSG